MKRNEYLDSAFKKFNNGEISAEAYDAILMNADAFVEPEEELEEDDLDVLFPNINERLFVQEAYERYQLDWCNSRRVRLDDVDEELGVNGECYASLKEFLDNEYRDKDFMKYLLGDDKFEWWENTFGYGDGLESIEKPGNKRFEMVGTFQPFKKYRVVLTCFDYNGDSYNECYEKLFDECQDAHECAQSMATSECMELNGEGDSCVAPNVGCFEVDDCANNDFEVRWYEQKPEERDEGSCDIEYVTTYNVYPVEFVGPDIFSCKYRGFDVRQADEGLKIYHNGMYLSCTEDIVSTALDKVDEICLECAKDKTCALEAVHKVPLEVMIKFASEVRDNEHSDTKEIKRNVGER